MQRHRKGYTAVTGGLMQYKPNAGLCPQPFVTVRGNAIQITVTNHKINRGVSRVGREQKGSSSPTPSLDQHWNAHSPHCSPGLSSVPPQPPAAPCHRPESSCPLGGVQQFTVQLAVLQQRWAGAGAGQLLTAAQRSAWDKAGRHCLQKARSRLPACRDTSVVFMRAWCP